MHDLLAVARLARLRLPVMLSAWLLLGPLVGLQAADFDEVRARCPGVSKYADEIAAKLVPPPTPTQPTQPKLRKQILAMERADQGARNT